MIRKDRQLDVLLQALPRPLHPLPPTPWGNIVIRFLQYVLNRVFKMKIQQKDPFSSFLD